MSVYVPPASNTGGSCSGSCGTENDLRYRYLGSYFNAHMLSYPSHRYAYIMYFTFVGILLVASAMHHLGVGDQTWLGAGWAKFAPKSRLIKLGKPPPPPSSDSMAVRTDSNAPQAQARKFRIHVPFMTSRYVFSFPSFGRVILLFVMAAIPIVLTLVGADYINPSSSMFDLSYSWPSKDAGRYGYYGKRSLTKRIQWGIGNNVATGVNAPTFSVPYHTWWTSGGRAGLMTNALTPIVVILSLKQVPWAVMSTKVFGQHAFERLSFLHKWGGRLLFAFAAAHTIAWSIQLDKDQQFGTNIWAFVFLWPRFRWAFVSLGFLTLLVILSISPIRKHYYEWFYISHIICAIGFMVAAALHHPPLGPWMWAALAWWAAERLTRAVKVAYVNGIGFAGRKPEVQLNPQHMAQHRQPPPNGNGYGWINPDAQKPPPPPTGNGYFSNTGESHPGPLDPHHHQPSRHYGGRDEKQSVQSDESPPPAFLQHDPAGHHASSAPEEDWEWELDENGDKVRRRPSRRYGPVSDLLKEYASPMSGIEEDAWSPRNSQYGAQPNGKHLSEHEGDLGIATTGAPKRRPSAIGDTPLSEHHHSSPDAPASHSSHLPYSSGPSSSADHYTSGSHSQMPLYRAPPSNQHPQSAPNAASYQRHTPSVPSYHTQPHSEVGHLHRQPRPALPADVAALLKPGYAFAQVLPGKTLRLTLRTPNRMSWAPGQWVYLNIPAIQGWQSHPFTIASAHDGNMPRKTSASKSDIEKGFQIDRSKGEERTMVLLLRARKGFTLKLWEHVKTHRHRQLTAAAETTGGAPASKTTSGVHLRAIVDGAYGSVERVRWGVHSTVVIVCGGSGVSFGISVLEHLCACLKEMNEYGATHRGGKNFAVKKVRFVWACREFSHLQWIASALRRCIEMVPPEQLQVDLFVTHLNNQAAMGGMVRGGQRGPVRPGTATSAGGESSSWQNPGEAAGWRDAHGNVYNPDEYGSGRMQHSRLNTSTSNGNMDWDAETEALQMDTVGLTQFEGEDDEGPTAREMQINNEIRKEGKLRRAHTRRVTLKKKNRGDKGNDDAGPSRPQESQAMAAQRMMYEGNVPARVGGGGEDPSASQQGQRRRRGSRGNGLSGFLSRDSSPNGRLGDHQRTTLYDGPSSYPQQENGYASDPLNATGGGASNNVTPNQPWLGPNDASRGGTAPSPSLSPSDMSPTPTGSGALTPRPYTPPFGSSGMSGFGEAGTALGTHGTPMPIPGTPRSFHSTFALDQPQQQQQSRNAYHRSESRLLGSATPTTPFDDVQHMSAADNLDSPIDLDSEEDLDLRIIAELAQFGHPRFDRIIAQEIRNAQGRTMVAACGPSNLAALLRRIVARHIDPARVRKGDLKAHVNLCMESFEWGGA